MRTMKEWDDSRPLEEDVQADCAYLGCKRKNGLRGRGPSGKLPFIAAVRCNTTGDPVGMRLSVVDGFRRRSMQQWAQSHLADGTWVTTDGLSSLTGIQGAGFRHFAVVTCHNSSTINDTIFGAVNTILGNVKAALTGTCRSTLIAHAPRYLAESCH